MRTVTMSKTITRRILPLTLLACCGWALGAPPEARAQEPIALVVVEADPEADGAIAQVRRELTALAPVVLVKGCEPLDRACVARKTGERPFTVHAYVAVWRTASRSSLSLGLVETGSDQQVFVEQPCKTRDCQVAALKVARDALGRWPSRGGRRIDMHGSPKGALIFDNGSLVGKLPGALQLGHGRHVVQVRAPGYLEFTEIFPEGAAVADVLRVDLEPAPPPDRKRGDGGRRWRLALGALLSAAGAGMAAFGATQLSDRCASGNQNGCQEFREKHVGAGAGFLVAGTLSLSTGVALLVRGARKERPHD